MKQNRDIRFPKVAIIDWGIGGISFYRILKAHYTTLPVVYFSDSGTTPYGKQSRSQLHSRLINIIHYLNNRGAEYLVVACNAMSTILPQIENKNLPKNFRLTGVITHTIKTLQSQQRLHRIGIVGGIRTIRSRAYQKPFIYSNQKIIQRIAQPLSAMIESGKMRTIGFDKTLDRIVQPLNKCDALVLACTHYTAAFEIFEGKMPSVKIIDPCESTFRFVDQSWKLKYIQENRRADVFLTTGDPKKTRESIQKAFSINTGAFQKIPLNL